MKRLVLMGAVSVLALAMAPATAVAAPGAVPVNERSRAEIVEAWGGGAEEPVPGEPVESFYMSATRVQGQPAMVYVDHTIETWEDCVLPNGQVEQTPVWDSTFGEGPADLTIGRRYSGAEVTATVELARVVTHACAKDGEEPEPEPLGPADLALALSPTSPLIMDSTHQAFGVPSLYRSAFRQVLTGREAAGSLALDALEAEVSGYYATFNLGMHEQGYVPMGALSVRAAAAREPLVMREASAEVNGEYSAKGWDEGEEPEPGDVVWDFTAVQGVLSTEMGAVARVTTGYVVAVACGEDIGFDETWVFGKGPANVVAPELRVLESGSVQAVLDVSVEHWDGCTGEFTVSEQPGVDVAADMLGVGPIQRGRVAVTQVVRGTGNSHVQMTGFARSAEGTVSVGGETWETTYGSLQAQQQTVHVNER